MKVLYIGGTGEISLACVLASVAAGHDVTVFNRGFRATSLPREVMLVKGDLRDASSYEELAIDYYDVVCQFLAYTPDAVDRDIAHFGGHCGQYVFISTASAYRKPGSNDAITESTPLENPYWAYSRSKAECEAHLFAADNFPVTVVRPSHTYRERIPSTVIPGDHLVWRLRNNKPVIVHDDGESLWTLTHATDFAYAFTRLFGEPRALNDAFHITSDDARSWNDILACVAELLGCSIDIRPVPVPTLVASQPDWEGPLRGDKANSLVFDNTKVKALVPEWRCEVSLRTGVEAAIKKLLERPGGLPTPDPAVDGLIDRIIEMNFPT